MKDVRVQTPQGEKYHGGIEGDTFFRSVTQKDLMRIFNAWSIHPEALKQLEVEGIKWLCYKEGGEEYKITVEDARKNGFTKSFSGGETIYIQLKYWNKKL